MSKQQIQDAERRVAETQHEREGQLARMRQVRTEYDALGETLKVLPERIKRPVMVPFGKLALFEGSLRHTNEVTVLLGENIFAKRSASQAAGIANRRAEFVQTQIDNLTSELSHLQSEREKLCAMRTLGIGAGRGGSTPDPWGLGCGDADGVASGLVTNPDGTVEIREEYEEGEWDHGRDGGGGGAGGSGSGGAEGGVGLARGWSPPAAVQEVPAKKPEAFKQQVLERIVDSPPPVMSVPPAAAPGPKPPVSAAARDGDAADSAATEEPPISQDGGKRVSRFMASRQ